MDEVRSVWSNVDSFGILVAIVHFSSFLDWKPYFASVLMYFLRLMYTIISQVCVSVVSAKTYNLLLATDITDIMSVP